ncbi:unnamed protein product [Microthlaspi erraticum]|uniref:MADS-box domain-containing protein n=1 Tax=Microthlaspi erraticum TaxID=1685480 RepID=A0A6D2KMB1_9BRAS|nr:unnamed protein product [Microthlaspi erraticum]
MASSSSSSFSPSSSSPPTKKKTTKSSLFLKSSSSNVTSLTKRQETVFKKAYELSVLCGIEVCVICYGSNGELKTWPEDREKVNDMARRYSELSKEKRRKGSVNLPEFLEKIKKDDAKKKKKNKKKKVVLESSFKYPDWDPRFDNYSVEQLTQLIQSLERNWTRMKIRLGAVVEGQKQSNMHNTNMAGQEQRMTTTATMNHLQQHSNHVPMDLLNHGNATLSQIPLPASAFDQGQSLAPLPSSLMIYPNSNVGRYSGLLGMQDTGMNEYPNMLTYNNYNNTNSFWKQFYQNCQGEDMSSFRGVQETNMSVEDFAGLPGMQGTGINGMQNFDMSMYNSYANNNGLSHQHVQFPTQRAAPVFQYMDR